MIRELAASMNARNRRRRASHAASLQARIEEAHREVDRLVREFRSIDPDLECVVLFGSLARGDVTRLTFDIDLAVSSRHYIDLLRPALDSAFDVDLIDLESASQYILDAIKRDGVEKYRAGT